MTSRALTCLLVVAVLGCSSSQDPAASGAGASGSGQAGSGQAGNAGSAGNAGNAGSSGSGGADGGSVKVTMAAFTVAPGKEAYFCQNFANPFGEDAEIAKFESHMTGGSHHLLMFYKTNATDGALETCSGLEFAPTPYGTQLPDDQVTFPEGIAAAIPKTTGLRLQSHYLNTTDQPIDAKVEVTLRKAVPGTVKAHAGVLFMVQPNFKVSPNSTQIVTRNCKMPIDMNVIQASSHMHQHATLFESSVAGTSVFTTKQWDSPKPALFAPPLAFKAGDPISFSCTFQNNTSQTLTFGESALTNEMCISTMLFYPVPDGMTTLDCK